MTRLIMILTSMRWVGYVVRESVHLHTCVTMGTVLSNTIMVRGRFGLEQPLD